MCVKYRELHTLRVGCFDCQKSLLLPDTEGRLLAECISGGSITPFSMCPCVAFTKSMAWP